MYVENKKCPVCDVEEANFLYFELIGYNRNGEGKVHLEIPADTLDRFQVTPQELIALLVRAAFFLFEKASVIEAATTPRNVQVH